MTARDQQTNMADYLSEWSKIRSAILLPGGRWCTEFFDKWAVLIEQETGVKIHNDGDGLTRMERYAVAETCAIRVSKKNVK